MEAISYDNKNVGGFLDRFMGNDNPPQVTENFSGKVLIEGYTGSTSTSSNTFPQGITCNTFFDHTHTGKKLIKYKESPDTIKKSVKDEFKKCPMSF